MSKKQSRTPKWKITAAVAGCAVISPLLFIVAVFLESNIPASEGDASKQPVFTVPSVLMLLGAAVGLLGVLGIIWLVWRVRSDRVPAWQKNVDRLGQPKR